MILVVRSELVRRYPSVLVAAVPGEWNGRQTVRPSRTRHEWCCRRSEVASAPTCSMPDSHSRHWPMPSARRTPTGLPGWFFLLSENPGDPRFGLDPDGGTAPPTRATLSWGHLSPTPDGPYAPVGLVSAGAGCGVHVAERDGREHGESGASAAVPRVSPCVAADPSRGLRTHGRHTSSTIHP